MSDPTRGLAFRIGAAATLIGAALLGSPTAAQELYSDVAIDAARQRRGPILELIVIEDIPNALPRARRAGVAGIGIEFIDRGPHPLSFASHPASRTVIVPIESVLFLDDLATATEWFQARGCRWEYIQSYLSALLLERRTLPPPLEAFAIDRDTALADPAVNDASTNTYNIILVFLLAHEMGHLVLGHSPGLTGEASQAQEIAADAFALDLFTANATPPVHMVDYFLAARWLDPTGTAVAAGTHPVTPGRLRALADRLAAHPDAFAPAFDDPGRGAEVTRDLARQLRMLADLSTPEAMITLVPGGLARDFPLSRLATACPT